jgi:hypothetical protein
MILDVLVEVMSEVIDAIIDAFDRDIHKGGAGTNP